ncbi:MAG: 2-polyprenylphenol 6-hydroxylase [Pseudomonadota bacterium]
MLTNLKYSLRLLGIGWTLARHDALFGLEALNAPAALLWVCRRAARRHRGLRLGQRLSVALQALGPSFIKAGQALSTRADLIGEEIARDLTELQDNVPPFDSARAKEMVEEQLGAPITQLFSQFDEDPVAAASIAQVHFAVTTDGREVAVKILRPNIERAFQRDIDLMFWIAHLVERRLPKYRRLKPVQVVETFASTIRLELDMRFEAAAAEELRANTKDDADFYVPTVDWERTARRVLTTERIRGISAGDIEGLKAAGLDLTRIMEHAARAFFNQVFRDGFFHADMHPGNLFVLPDGTLAPVDFGIMGRIDRENQLILAQILWGFLQGDYMKVAQLHHDAGWIPAHVNVDQFAQAVRAVGAPIMGKAMNEISVGRLLGQLIAIAQMFEMEAQPHLLLLQKTMMTAEGVGRGLNPTINMWQLSEPLIRDWAASHLSGPARMKAFAHEAIEILKDAPHILRQLKSLLESELNEQTSRQTQEKRKASAA